MSVVLDLQRVVRLAAVPGETPEDYTKRLIRKVAALTDDEWELLDTESQVWANDATDALRSRRPLPLPAGVQQWLRDAGAVVEEEAPKGRRKRAVAPEAEATPAEEKIKQPGKAKKPNAGRNVVGRKGKFTTDAVISLLVSNPYRETSKAHGVFKKYREGMTVAEAVAAGIGRAYIRWDINHRHIEVSEPSS